MKLRVLAAYFRRKQVLEFTTVYTVVTVWKCRDSSAILKKKVSTKNEGVQGLSSKTATTYSLNRIHNAIYCYNPSSIMRENTNKISDQG